MGKWRHRKNYKQFSKFIQTLKLQNTASIIWLSWQNFEERDMIVLTLSFENLNRNIFLSFFFPCRIRTPQCQYLHLVDLPLDLTLFGQLFSFPFFTSRLHNSTSHLQNSSTGGNDQGGSVWQELKVPDSPDLISKHLLTSLVLYVNTSLKHSTSKGFIHLHLKKFEYWLLNTEHTSELHTSNSLKYFSCWNSIHQEILIFDCSTSIVFGKEKKISNCILRSDFFNYITSFTLQFLSSSIDPTDTVESKLFSKN